MKIGMYTGKVYSEGEKDIKECCINVKNENDPDVALTKLRCKICQLTSLNRFGKLQCQPENIKV